MFLNSFIIFNLLYLRKEFLLLCILENVWDIIVIKVLNKWMKERIIYIINNVYVSYGILDLFNILILFRFILRLNIVRNEFLKVLNFFIFVLW